MAAQPPSQPPSQPPPPPPPSSPPPSVSNNTDTTQYWCHQCNKRVPVETLPDHTDIICFECKNGFVESISVSSHNQRVTDEEEEEEEETPAFGNKIVHILRPIAQAAREDDDEPPPPPSDHPTGDQDYLRIELDGWRNESIDEDEQDPHQRDPVGARFDDNDDQPDEDDDDDDDDDDINDDDINDDDDLVRRDRRDLLRGFASRAARRRSRLLDCAESLTQLEELWNEFRLQATGDDDVFIGNPGVAAGFEDLLQTLEERRSSGGRRGAPPASKSAVERLLTVEVESSDCEICAVCKDGVLSNEGKIVKQLECGHVYHGDCIVQWLSLKNSCPVCRFELPTDDPDFEQDRRRRSMAVAAAAMSDRGCSSSSGGGD